MRAILTFTAIPFILFVNDLIFSPILGKKSLLIKLVNGDKVDNSKITPLTFKNTQSLQDVCKILFSPEELIKIDANKCHPNYTSHLEKIIKYIIAPRQYEGQVHAGGYIAKQFSLKITRKGKKNYGQCHVQYKKNKKDQTDSFNKSYSPKKDEMQKIIDKITAAETEKKLFEGQKELLDAEIKLLEEQKKSLAAEKKSLAAETTATDDIIKKSLSLQNQARQEIIDQWLLHKKKASDNIQKNYDDKVKEISDAQTQKSTLENEMQKIKSGYDDKQNSISKDYETCLHQYVFKTEITGHLINNEHL